MNRKLYALVLEDIQRDAELLKEILSDEGFDLDTDVVETEQDYVSNLKRHNYDVIFADFTLPSFNGQAALELAKKMCPNIPFICISGTIGEDRAVELLKQGATDYVLKDRMERLAFATKRALDAAVQLNKFRMTEIELQTNRRLLQTIINNALDAIYIKDLKGRYLLFNEAAEKALNVVASDVIGKDDTSIFPAEDAGKIMELDRRVIENGVPLNYEESTATKEGKVITFHTIKCPMFDDFGNPSGLFGITRDITERKQMELSLTDAKEKAEESDRLKTAFLNNISHEIRTPMNAIVGFSSVLNDPDLEPELRKQYTDIITQSSEQLLSIITNIVSIASIEAGQTKVTNTTIELSSIFAYLQAQFVLNAKEKNLDLILEPDAQYSELEIITDEKMLMQILSNLISNAIKFTRKGSVHFGCKVKKDDVEFFVRDTGIGIEPQMQDNIFKRFHQVEITSAREFGGSGLGLSISKAYVELLGGKIWLVSELGKGSAFHFTIPVKRGLL